jgi:hypothetical protein
MFRLLLLPIHHKPKDGSTRPFATLERPALNMDHLFAAFACGGARKVMCDASG